MILHIVHLYVDHHYTVFKEKRKDRKKYLIIWKKLHRNQKKIIHLTVSSLNNDKCRTVAMVENTSIMFFGHNKGSAVKLTIIWDKLENVHNPWSLRLWSWWWKLHPDQCNRSFLSELLCASALGGAKSISSVEKIGRCLPSIKTTPSVPLVFST